MKNVISILLILCLFISCERKSGKRIYSQDNQTAVWVNKDIQCDYCVKVISITDGDTFKGLTNDKKVIKFRIYGIDAPDKKQAFFTIATKYLADLISDEQVCIRMQRSKNGNPRKSWDRFIVWVYTSDGNDVSAQMLKAGMAWHYKEYDSTPEYAKYELSARDTRLGLWVDLNPIAPWDFRKGKR